MFFKPNDVRSFSFICHSNCFASVTLIKCFVQKMKVTYVGVELVELKSGDLRWCLDFRDMDTPAIILLSQPYGTKNHEHGGFVLCPLYGRKSKAFQAASGTSNAAIISNLVWCSLIFVSSFCLIFSFSNYKGIIFYHSSGVATQPPLKVDAPCMIV